MNGSGIFSFRYLSIGELVREKYKEPSLQPFKVNFLASTVMTAAVTGVYILCIYFMLLGADDGPPAMQQRRSGDDVSNIKLNTAIEEVLMKNAKGIEDSHKFCQQCAGKKADRSVKRCPSSNGCSAVSPGLS